MNTDCYTQGYICEVVDNFAFKIQTGKIYESVLNPSDSCCISIPGLVLTSRFGKTFLENDPVRTMKITGDPTDAAFDNKIDGHYFQPDICEMLGYETAYNIEPINFYEYSLSSLQTELTVTDPITAREPSINDKLHNLSGRLYIRNTRGDVIDTAENLLPNLQYSPEIYNNITSYNIVYDNIIIYTETSLYIEHVNYNYTTGRFESSTVTPVRLSASEDPRHEIMRHHFNPDDQDIMLGEIVPIRDNLLVPKLYRYNANTHTYDIAYNGANDTVKLGLPPDIYFDYTIVNVDKPIITYNKQIQKYTVVCVVSLAATPEAVARAGEFDSLVGEFYSVVIYNFKNYKSGLELIDSVIYHTPNKRQFKFDIEDSVRYISLSSTNEFINAGYISDPNTQFILNFKDVPVRESKLKHVSVTYDDKTTTRHRLPVNDMFYADLPHVKDMVEGYVPHASGGPLDFASPRYQDIPIDLDLNLNEVSTVYLSGEAAYYDGHVERYKIYGESRPLPIQVVFKKLSLIDAVSYTTDTSSNLLKLTFESEEPRYITNIVVNNGSSAETTSDIIVQRNLLTPRLSTIPASSTPDTQTTDVESTVDTQGTSPTYS